MSDDIRLTGGCLCGEVRYQVEGEPLEVYICHCTMCQKYSGATSSAAATFPFESYTLIQGDPRINHTSAHYSRMSCRQCGSILGGRQSGDSPKLVTIRLGNLDNPSALKPTSHVFTSTRVEWCNIDEGLHTFANMSPEQKSIWIE